MIFKKKFLNKDLSEFIAHGKNYVTADIFTKGLAFLSIPIFTRLLTPEDYGIVAIFTTFISLFTIVVGLGMRGAVTRYYYEKTNDFGSFIGSVFLFVITWGILIISLIFIFRLNISDYFKLPTDVIKIGALVVFFNALFEIYLSYLRASKQSYRVSYISVVRAVLFLVLSILFTVGLKEHKYLGSIYAQIIVWSLLFVFSLYSILKVARFNLKRSYFKYAFLFGTPIAFHLISQFVLGSFDQIIINEIIGSKETGLYAFAYKIGMIQSIISMGLLKSWTPIFYEKMNEFEFENIEILAKKYSIIIFGLALALGLFAKEIIYIFADKAYYSSLSIVPVIVVSYLFFFLYTIYVGYAFYSKKTYYVAFFTIFAGTINIFLNYKFIPIFGYKIAAWTTLASYFLLFVFHYINLIFVIKSEVIIRLKIFLPNMTFVIGLLLIYFMFFATMDNYLLELFLKIVFLVSGFIVLLNKQILNNFKNAR